MATTATIAAVEHVSRPARARFAAGPRRRAPRMTLEDRQVYERIPDEIDYVDNPAFAAPDAEARLFGPGCEVEVPEWTCYAEVAEDTPVRPVGRTTLTSADEAKLFLRFNYARLRLSNLLAAQRKRRRASRGPAMVRWFREVQRARSSLVRANLALVLAMAKRTRIPRVQFNELVSEGNMALLRSIDKFDVARGFKFSTYACRAVLKSFNRLASKSGRYCRRFGTEYDPDLDRSDFNVRRHERQHEDFLDAVGTILTRNLARLSDVEQTVVRERFALDSDQPKPTLSEVGKKVGLSNERVRQIQNSALGKLRYAINEFFLAS